MSQTPPHDFVRRSLGARTLPGVPEENYWFRRHEAAYQFAVEAVASVRWSRDPPRVLDAGCGEGYGAARLGKVGKVVAAELDAEVASHAGRSYPNVAVIRGDVCALPFAAASFEAVVALQLIEHLYCADRFLASVRRILRPEGLLVLSTPNRDTSPPDPNPFHVYEYTSEELVALLRLHFDRVTMLGVRHRSRLRRLDRQAGGSLPNILLRTPFGELPRRLRRGVERTRARHFEIGRVAGPLDLMAVASGGSAPKGA